MITLPIWLFVLCILFGFPLAVIILTVIGYIIYMGCKIGLNLLESINWVDYDEIRKWNKKMGRY